MFRRQLFKFSGEPELELQECLQVEFQRVRQVGTCSEG